jgi:hypothetical protein
MSEFNWGAIVALTIVGVFQFAGYSVSPLLIALIILVLEVLTEVLT